MERASIEEEEQTQTDLVSTSNDLFELCNNFRLDDENLWQSFACNLFSAGLDSIGYEVGQANFTLIKGKPVVRINRLK